MSESFELPSPDHFTVGAVGEPGQRVFYLQGRQTREVVTLKVEKGQISALADYVAGLLAKLPEAGTVSTDPALLEPIEPMWAVGALGLGYDESSDRLVVVANEAVEHFKQLLAAENRKQQGDGGKPGEVEGAEEEGLGDVDIIGAAVADELN